MHKTQAGFYETEVLSRLDKLDKRIKVGNLGEVGLERTRYPLYFVEGPSNGMTPRVLLSAGVHGDEPAGVYAILDFLDELIFKYANYSFFILPCLNPWGFEYNKRENMHGTDINRSFVNDTSEASVLIKKYISSQQGYLLAMDLHEDNTNLEVEGFPKESNPKGFFVYESLFEGKLIGPPMIKILRQYEIKVCEDEQIYAEKNQEGVVFSKSIDGEFDQILEIFTNNTIVTETPTCWSLEQRIHAQSMAISTALDLLSMPVWF